MEKKQNKVNLTQKKPNNSAIKKEVAEETSNSTMIIVVAVILALILGIILYWQISKNDDKKEPKKSSDNNNSENVEKKDNKDTEEKSTYVSDLVSSNSTTEVSNTNSEENDSEDEEEVFYALSFNVNGGEAVDKQVLSSTDKTESVLPKREGWSFGGWFVDPELSEEFIFGRVLTDDTTLYAKWVKVVEFKTMDGLTTIASKEYAENDTIFMPSKADIINFVDEDKEVAWVLKTVLEDGSETYTELLNPAKLTDEIPSENGKVILYLKQLQMFQIQVFMNESDEEPFDVVDAVEDRALDLSELEVKLNEESIAEYALYYRNNEGVKYTFFKDQKASLDITKLYLDGAYTVKYTDYVDDQNQEDEVVLAQDNDEDEADTNLNNNNENNVENNSQDTPVVVFEQEVAKDSHIAEDQIPVVEKEDSDFVGWFEDLDDDSTMLTENTIIDEDKVYIAKWKKKEEILADTVNEDSVSPSQEQQIENTEQPNESDESDKSNEL